MNRAALALVVVALSAAHRAEAQELVDSHRLHWGDHPRIQPGELVFTGLALAGAAAIEFGVPEPRRPKWVGPVLADAAIRDALVQRTLDGRERVLVLSNVLLAASAIWPLGIDGTIIPAIDHNLDVMGQMQAINAEAYALGWMLTRASHRIFARERPAGIGCKKDPHYDADCGKPNLNASFFSGHSSMSAVGSGLTCAHHAYLPLYGGGAPDVLACVGATSLALGVAATRIVADRHWTSDAVTGFLVGYGVGWAVPLAFHYTQHDPTTKARVTVPSVEPAMFTWAGSF